MASSSKNAAASIQRARFLKANKAKWIAQTACLRFIPITIWAGKCYFQLSVSNCQAQNYYKNSYPR